MIPIDIYWYWLVNIPHVGRITIQKLLKKFENPYNIFMANASELLECIENEKKVSMISDSKDICQIEKAYRCLDEKHIVFVHPDSSMYPAVLKCIPDMPYGLYLKGKMPDTAFKSIAIIGTRNCTRYGMEMARYFGRELAACNINIVSGLAKGVDGYAHIGALEAGGYTLGVLGCGIDQIYPVENFELFMQMEERGGIISESNLGIKPFAGLFPQRNRIISGICDGILVIEAMEKSGTFITVDQGLEQGKEVFAIPGRVTDQRSVGCNNLIKSGAHIVTEVQDVLDILGIQQIVKNRITQKERIQCIEQKMSLAPLEKIVYSCLRIEPKYLDDIIYEVKVAPWEVCKALNSLVIKDIVIEAPRNYYAVKL